MDPNACLEELDACVITDDYEYADRYCDDLANWLEKQGFQPDWEKYKEGSEYFFSRYPGYRP